MELLPRAPTSPVSEPIVLHLLSAGRLPALLRLNRSLLAPYAVAWLTDADGRVLCDRKRWPVLPQGNREPVWNSAHLFPLAPEHRSDPQLLHVHVELWDRDALLSDNMIGRAEVPLASLVATGTLHAPLTPSSLSSPSPGETSPPSSPFKDSNELAHLIKRGVHGLTDTWWDGTSGLTPRSLQCSVQMRLLRGHPQRKRLFVVRHGESVWNKGQSELDLAAMYSQVDHGLSAAGRQQAEALAAHMAAAVPGAAPGVSAAGEGNLTEEDAAALRELRAAEAVLCSPLTRALQTCLIGLGEGLRAQARVVQLVPGARERRNHGSVDSIGCTVGEDEVRARLAQTTAELYGCDEAAERVLGGVRLDDQEVRQRWWSVSPDAAEEVRERLADFMRRVRFSPEETIVLVGHSHWIRELLRTYLGASVAEQDPAFAEQLRARKLSNCGVARLECDFGEGGAAERPIVGVRLLAGTKLVK